jgi:transposase-like protein
MTSLELLKEIEAWLCFNAEPSSEETAKLRKSIKNHVTEQLRKHDVSGLLCPRCKSSNILEADKENDNQCKDCNFVWA